MKGLVHAPLKVRGGVLEPHGHHSPEVCSVWVAEGGDLLTLWGKWYLPETSFEVQFIIKMMPPHYF